MRPCRCCDGQQLLAGMAFLGLKVELLLIVPVLGLVPSAVDVPFRQTSLAVKARGLDLALAA